MQTFNFPYHKTSTSYPDSTTRVQFGKSYVFTAKPNAPDQRMFTLKFQGMKYYLTSGGSIDQVTNPQMNMAVLEKFYQDHQQWDVFYYPHPVYGTLQCRFHNPLEIPDPIPGGSGVLEPFEVKLIEVK